MEASSAVSSSSASNSTVDIRPKGAGAHQVKRFVRQQVPQEILDDPELKVAMRDLPPNYNFEIPKTIWRLKKINVNVSHLIETIQLNFESDKQLVLAGTIQFVSSIQAARAALSDMHPCVTIPQAKPLSGGEVLGCTAPVVDREKADAIVFVADGRFHLEAIMIANPSIPAYRYDPYSQVLTREEYDQEGMRAARRKAIEQAQGAKQWGVILGTLGRQGNPRILSHVLSRLRERGLKWTVFLLSEISPAKLAILESSMDAWIQIACPRLSIDWGEGFQRPLLTPYEAEVSLNFLSPWWGTPVAPSEVPRGPADYPMDYYARDGGPWNSTYAAPARKASGANRLSAPATSAC